MKRVIFLLMGVLLLTSLASAEIILKEQPKELYSLGEIITIPTKIATSSGIEQFFSMKLICNGIENEIHKQYISLPVGGEQEINTIIPLTFNFIGRSSGTCTLKASLGEDYILSNDFTISNSIFLDFTPSQTEVAPEQEIIIEGTATKENGENVQGFIEVQIMEESPIIESDTVKNGYFYVNMSLPKETKAGQYLVKINIFEKDRNGNISNQGFTEYNLLVTQIPTNLELVFENPEIIPDETLKVKAILHDQTGEKIESTSTITLKNEKGKALDQVDIATDEYFEYPIEYNQPPVEWTIIAKVGELIAEETFNISEKEKADIEVINKTIIITNRGNVPYNESVIIKIGNQTIDFDTYLEVDEEKKYSLSAPEGEYEVEIRVGENKATKTVLLTGNAIKVEEVNGGGVLNVIKFPFVWIFLIAILGFMAVIIFKKGYRKTFIGYIQKHRNKKKLEKELPIKKFEHSLVTPSNPAILSLSIKGDKQDTSLICLKIKNKKDIEKNNIAKEVFQKITEIAEGYKAVTYQSQNDIIFMLVPAKTKTFKNQKKAIEIAQEAKEILDKYNKLAKKRIDYGLSLNYGTIIAKPEKTGLSFMSLGSLVKDARKVATLSTGEIYLTEKMREKTISNIKSKKHEKQGTIIYTIEQIKTKSAETKKFIHNFVEKLEKENKEARERKSEK